MFVREIQSDRPLPSVRRRGHARNSFSIERVDDVSSYESGPSEDEYRVVLTGVDLERIDIGRA